MFPATANLETLIRQPRDVLWATRKWCSSSTPYQTGQVLTFWMEGDPRTESGIVLLCQYRCVASGDEATSQWEKIAANPL